MKLSDFKLVKKCELLIKAHIFEGENFPFEQMKRVYIYLI